MKLYNETINAITHWTVIYNLITNQSVIINVITNLTVLFNRNTYQSVIINDIIHWIVIIIAMVSLHFSLFWSHDHIHVYKLSNHQYSSSMNQMLAVHVL